jgi:hypothetical protein
MALATADATLLLAGHRYSTTIEFNFAVRKVVSNAFADRQLARP